MTEIQRLEKRVEQLELHIHNLMQTGRFHEEALTTLFERTEPAKPVRKSARAVRVSLERE